MLEHQGDFFSCDRCVDAEHHLGNIRDTPPAELLESPELITFGRNKLDQLPRYCRDCEVLDLCYDECPKNRLIRTPDGEEGLNSLCEGYRVFFNHSRPFVRERANLWRRQTLEGRVPHTGTGAGPARRTRIGRNDPSPCGSGKQCKKCCLRKEA